MNKRAFLYLIIITLIIAISIIFFFPQENTFKKQTRFFKIRDTSQITRIDIIKKNEIIRLTKSDIGNWEINDKYYAQQEIIHKIIGLIAKFEVQSSLSSKDNIKHSNEIENNKIEIKLFKNRRTLNEFIISRVLIENNDLTIIMNKNKPELFVIKAPGYPYSIYSVFNTNINFLRNKILINFLPTQIKQVELINFLDSSKSFFLINEGKREYEIYNIMEPELELTYNKDAVERYLGYFRNIEFEKEISDNHQLFDSLKQSLPYMNITVIKNNFDSASFIIYHKPIEERENLLGEKITVDPDFCYLIYVNMDAVYLMKYIEIEPIIKEISYFIKPVKRED